MNNSQPDTQGSVYGAPTPQYTNTGATLYGATTMDDDQTHSQANGEPLDPQLLQDYENHGPKSDYLNQNPGKYRTNRPSPTYKVAIPRPVVSASSVVMMNTGMLAGINFREISGTAGALINLRKGLDATQAPIMTISLAANESVRDFFGSLPIECLGGLYMELVNGSIAGTVYTVEERNV